MKLLGLAAIALCAAAFALELRRRMRLRLTMLDGICELCREISVSIRYERRPLGEIMLGLPGDASAFARICAEQLSRGLDFRAAWRYACENCAELAALSADERALLTALGERLGRSDADGELELLEGVSGRFESARDAVRDELPSRTKLTTACSLTGGLLLLIFLI